MEYPNLETLSTDPHINQISLELGGGPVVGAGCCEPEQTRKGENRMKIQVYKSVAFIVTAVTVEMVKLLAALRPQALVLTDETKKELFRISEGKEPSISAYGIVLAEKKDLMIISDKPVTEAHIKKTHPQLFLHLPALERQILAQYEEVQAQVGEVAFEVLEAE